MTAAVPPPPGLRPCAPPLRPRRENPSWIVLRGAKNGAESLRHATNASPGPFPPPNHTLIQTFRHVSATSSRYPETPAVRQMQAALTAGQDDVA